MKHLTILIILALIPLTSNAGFTNKMVYSKLDTICVKGMVIVRSLQATFQLRNEEDKPMTCEQSTNIDKAANAISIAEIRVQIAHIEKKILKIDAEKDLEIGKLKVEAAHLQGKAAKLKKINF